LRIEESKQLLETSDEPVEEIAEKVGYQDIASFRRVFRRYVGVSPADYRRRSATPSHIRKLPS
jgi:AraC-like DNA-binding protein